MGENHVKNNTFAIFPAVTKSTEKHLIYVLIYDGIAENDHLFATGYFAAKGSRVPMSFKGTEELTLERNDSCVQNATKGGCEQDKCGHLIHRRGLGQHYLELCWRGRPICFGADRNKFRWYAHRYGRRL